MVIRFQRDQFLHIRKSAETIRRIECSHPTLVRLKVTNELSRYLIPMDNDDGYYCPRAYDDDDLQLLTGAVEKGNLVSLEHLQLCHSNLGFIRGRPWCHFAARCTHVKYITLFRIRNIDDFLGQFISIIPGLSRLESLDLSCNNIREAGCKALASLLQNSSINLVSFKLKQNQQIDDTCAYIIANALRRNNKLRRLSVDSRKITDKGWNAFSEALCDASSASSIYHSNHTLDYLDSDSIELPDKMWSVLSLHYHFPVLQSNPRSRDAMVTKKIVRSIPHIDMEPLLEWDLKVLPLVVSWFSRAMEYAGETRTRGRTNFDLEERDIIDRKKLSCIYQYARSVPLMFVPGRKRVNASKMMKMNKKGGIGRKRISSSNGVHVLHPSHHLKLVKIKGKWACDGCTPDAQEFPLSRRDRRFRCARCDFDLCYECFTI